MRARLAPGFDVAAWRRIGATSPLHDPAWLEVMASRLPGDVHTVTYGDALGFLAVVVTDPDAYEAYNPYAVLWRDPPVFDLATPQDRAGALRRLAAPPELTLPALVLVAPGYSGDPAGAARHDPAVVRDCLADLHARCAADGLAGLHVMYSASDAVTGAVQSLGGVSYPLTTRSVLPVWWDDWAGYLAGLPSKKRREIRRQARRAAEDGVTTRQLDPVADFEAILAGRCDLLRRYGQRVDERAERGRLSGLLDGFGDRLTAYGAVRRGEIVASSVCLRQDRTVHVVYSGAAGGRDEVPYAHFMATFYAVVQRVDRSRVDEIDYGIGHVTGKTLRGCVTRWLFGHALGVGAHRQRLLAEAARLLTGPTDGPSAVPDTAGREPVVDVEPEQAYRLRAGRLLRAVANDLKRDDAAAEADLGLPGGAFADLTAGRTTLTWELIRHASQVWPVNERDLLPVNDDCPAGVRIVRVAESVASARTLSRGGRPYYEYRDTAMSRIASYRPEWIRMIQVVSDDDPENPDVRWNEGHLLYQFTYFVGPVNYYHRWEGRSYCVPMGTGDSVWGLPFGPHSFAARSADEPAYILALTYGGDLLGDAQRELSVLGPAAARAMALPAGGAAVGQAALLRSFLDARLATPGAVAARAGLDPARLAELCAGGGPASEQETAQLADALGVSPRDLLPPVTGVRDGVRRQRHRDAPRWTYPATGPGAYQVTQLAGDPLHPHTTAVELTVHTPTLRDDAWSATYQHQYVYVLGDEPVLLAWEHRGERRTERLAPGDSCYVRPQVPLALARPGDRPPLVLLLRIGGAAHTDVRFALGSMAPGGIERYLDEDRLWYRNQTQTPEVDVHGQ